MDVSTGCLVPSYLFAQDIHYWIGGTVLYSKWNQGDLPAFMKSSSSPVVVNEESAKKEENKSLELLHLSP